MHHHELAESDWRVVYRSHVQVIFSAGVFCWKCCGPRSCLRNSLCVSSRASVVRNLVQ